MNIKKSNQNIFKKKPTDAFILAAGYGRRLLPLTEKHPKPLVEIAGKPMISYIIDALQSTNIENIYINAYYLSDQLEGYIKDNYSNIIISKEKELLDTGGALKYGIPADYDRSIYIINSDTMLLNNYKDLLYRLSEKYICDEADAVLALSKKEKAIGYNGDGDFFLDKNNNISKEDPGSFEKFVFMGISILNTKTLDKVSDKIFSLNIIWNNLILEKKCSGIIHESNWHHTGDLISLNNFEKYLIESK
jgi:MurNAc alpha-1-phosphate uridylyltransferase